MQSRPTPPPPDTLPEENHYPPRKSKVEAGGLLPPLWSIVLMLFLGFGMAGCLIMAVIAAGGRSSLRSSVEPVIVITPAPSPTSLLAELLQPTATLDPGSTPAHVQSISLSGPTLIPTATATPTPIAISVGAQVIVIGQGGINVRSAPGTASAINFTANNNETFAVIGGPEVADSLRWWQIRDPRNNRSGWVAENDGLADLIQVFVP
ncbi:MAG TPA: SH3 domain-containing protein [Spirillospora sp.]|nr:SH3 domain-containing protein [Spirillospora sp.]